MLIYYNLKDYCLVCWREWATAFCNCKYSRMRLHISTRIHFVDVYIPSILKVFVLLNDFLFNEILDCFSVECDLSTLRMAMIQKLGSVLALHLVWKLFMHSCPNDTLMAHCKGYLFDTCTQRLMRIRWAGGGGGSRRKLVKTDSVS